MLKLPLSGLIFTCLLLSACSDGAKLVDRAEHSPSRTQAASISHDGHLAFVATFEHGLRLIDTSTQEILYNWQQEQDGISQISAVAIAADNSVAVAASRETIALWDISTGDVRGYWRTDESTIRDIAVSNRGRHLIIGRNDGVILVFEPDTGRRLEFFGHSERINSIDVSPNGRYIISGADDHQSIVWQSDTGQIVQRLPADGRVIQVRFNPDGSSAFSASARTATIWQLPAGEIISELRYRSRHKSFISASFSANGQFLLTGSPSRHLELWDIASGKRLHSERLQGRDGEYPPRAAVIAVGFIGQSDTVISENSSGFAERWKFTALTENTH